MIGKAFGLFLILEMISAGQPARTELALSVCELSKDYGAYRDYHGAL